MYHPNYAWMFFNWYLDRWWFDNSSCVEQAQSLEAVIETSIVFDHYPRIERDRMDEPNIGKIVSIFTHTYVCNTDSYVSLIQCMQLHGYVCI